MQPPRGGALSPASQPTGESSKPVFVFISARTCPACQKFKMSWPDVRRQVEALGLVRIVEIEVATPADAKSISSSQYPPGLGSMATFVPIFFLVPASSWNSRRLDGTLCYGTSIKNGKAVSPKALSLKPEAVLNWIKASAK